MVSPAGSSSRQRDSASASAEGTGGRSRGRNDEGETSSGTSNAAGPLVEELPVPSEPRLPPQPPVDAPGRYEITEVRWDVGTDFVGSVVRRLEAAKADFARRHEVEGGRFYVRFRIDASGQPKDIAVQAEGASGSEEKLGIALVLAAAPFPVPDATFEIDASATIGSAVDAASGEEHRALLSGSGDKAFDELAIGLGAGGPSGGVEWSLATHTFRARFRLTHEETARFKAVLEWWEGDEVFLPWAQQRAATYSATIEATPVLRLPVSVKRR